MLGSATQWSWSYWLICSWSLLNIPPTITEFSVLKISSSGGWPLLLACWCVESFTYKTAKETSNLPKRKRKRVVNAKMVLGLFLVSTVSPAPLDLLSLATEEVCAQPSCLALPGSAPGNHQELFLVQRASSAFLLQHPACYFLQPLKIPRLLFRVPLN